MPFPLLPLAVASMVAAAYHQTSKPSAKGVMTPTRQYIFEAAMNSTKDPVSLRKLASTFREEGLAGPAEILEKRAKLRELSPETKAARNSDFAQSRVFGTSLRSGSLPERSGVREDTRMGADSGSLSASLRGL